MQSVNASACFVRVTRCCLGSILESCWEPGGPLYSFQVDFLTKQGFFFVGIFLERSREVRDRDKGDMGRPG